jgi:hypothetical protein
LLVLLFLFEFVVVSFFKSKQYKHKHEQPQKADYITKPGSDIFGHAQNELTQKNSDVFECANCHRTVNAARFAPHLEKCMGLGRNSSRIASRRYVIFFCCVFFFNDFHCYFFSFIVYFVPFFICSLSSFCALFCLFYGY